MWEEKYDWEKKVTTSIFEENKNTKSKLEKFSKCLWEKKYDWERN